MSEQSCSLEDRVRTQQQILAAALYNIDDYIFIRDATLTDISIFEPGSSSVASIEQPSLKHTGTDLTLVEVHAESLGSVETSEKPAADILERSSRSTSSCNLWTELCDATELQKYIAEPPASCKAVHIRKQHSFASLGITRVAFEQLCSDLEVFDSFKDVILTLGFKEDEIEVAPPRMRHRIGASETTYECCYSLRFIEKNNRQKGRRWSLRQFTVYQKSQAGTSSWIFISLPALAVEAFERSARSEGQEGNKNPFLVHLHLLATAISYWRPYVLERTADMCREYHEINMMRPTANARAFLSDGKARKRLKRMKEEIHDAMTSVRELQSTIASMVEFHQQTFRGASKEADQHDFGLAVERALHEQTQEADHVMRQLQLINTKLDGSIQIVAEFSQLSNGALLAQMAQEASRENEKIGRLAKATHNDSIAMKALTFIMLIYMPTATVLNFFSASFIDTSSGEMVLVGKWWLFVIISLPLTVVTLMFWAAWMLASGNLHLKVDWLLCRKRKVTDIEQDSVTSEDP